MRHRKHDEKGRGKVSGIKMGKRVRHIGAGGGGEGFVRRKLRGSLKQRGAEREGKVSPRVAEGEEEGEAFGSVGSLGELI